MQSHRDAGAISFLTQVVPFPFLCFLFRHRYSMGSVGSDAHSNSNSHLTSAKACVSNSCLHGEESKAICIVPPFLTFPHLEVAYRTVASMVTVDDMRIR